MKIGIEAQRIFRPKKHGMDIYALELIRAIQEIDKENEYVVFVKPDKDVCLKPSKNLRIVEVEGKTYADWEQISLPKAIKSEKIDLMHFTSNTASVNTNCPFVLTLHDIIYLENIISKGSLYQMAGHFYRRWNVPKITKRAKCVITVSEFEKIQIQKKLEIENSKLRATYNAFNPKFRIIDDENELNRIKEKYNLPNEFIFFLGNTAPKKNMKKVLEAYSKYIENEKNPVKIVIAESSVRDVIEILTTLNRRDIIKNVILIGYVNHDELPYIYNLASVFLYPSLRESFGIPIIEAMACGTPVVTSNTSAMPEVAGEAAILVDPFDSNSIREGFEKILTDKNLSNQLKINGLARAKDFSWVNTAKKTIEIYNNLKV
ncbi:MAG: glycosyltransferase family 4 protein [Spirosomaceae bacterium]|jgi:glycosyltransferase involved in cell wall biosynthesis|nr:glycosyltransferase family 4 protein [Spirosomataceae bacterium]